MIDVGRSDLPMGSCASLVEDWNTSVSWQPETAAEDRNSMLARKKNGFAASLPSLLPEKRTMGSILRKVSVRALQESAIERAQKREKAAKRIQNAFRLIINTFKHYGGQLFVMADGSQACFGTIAFSNSFVAKPARFLGFADSTSVAYLANFISHQWDLRTPDVLISVVGSAQDFQMSKHLESIFSVGLSSAATTTNAWIFTGGTDTGVMKLVGAAMQEKDAGTVPLIGIGPWGAINGCTVAGVDPTRLVTHCPAHTLCASLPRTVS